jgi:hypothetical protein
MSGTGHFRKHRRSGALFAMVDLLRRFREMRAVNVMRVISFLEHQLYLVST